MRKSAIATVVVALLATGCGSTVEVADVAAMAREVTVYEFSPSGRALALRPVRVTVADRGDAALNAVTGLLEHEPSGPGRHSFWNGACTPATAVTSVRRSPVRIMVELAEPGSDRVGAATCDLTGTGAAAQRQQMAWTVRTATGSRAPVKIVVDGRRLGPDTVADPDALASRDGMA